MVTAKFQVQQISRNKSYSGTGEMQTILLTPVTSGSEENKRFYAATPSGRIELSCVNAEAVKEFDLGMEVYIDFRPVPSTPKE